MGFCAWGGDGSVARAIAWKTETAAARHFGGGRATFDDLASLVLIDYEVNGRRSRRRACSALRHLTGAFGCRPADDIDTLSVVAYVQRRQRRGAANATINRELSFLKRGFRLGLRAGIVACAPHIDALVEDNVRTGFFEHVDLLAVVARLPAPIQPVIQVAYFTGWRVQSEILTRRWTHVDLAAGWLRIDPGEAKGGRGRMFPIRGPLRQALEGQRDHTAVVERELGRPVPWVFHRRGKRIRSFHRAWHTACRSALVDGRLPHDLRRTAIRNLERAGVPRTTGMALVGHRTESVYRRYAIVDEASLREGVEKLARHLADLDERPR